VRFFEYIERRLPAGIIIYERRSTVFIVDIEKNIFLRNFALMWNIFYIFANLM